MEESSDIQIDQEEFEQLWVEKAEVVAAKKKVGASISCIRPMRFGDEPVVAVTW